MFAEAVCAHRGAPSAASYTASGTFETVTVTGALVAWFPEVSYAMAVRVAGPSANRVVSQVAWKGGAVTVPSSVIPAYSSTFARPTSSAALACQDHWAQKRRRKSETDSRAPLKDDRTALDACPYPRLAERSPHHGEPHDDKAERLQRAHNVAMKHPQ